MADEKSDLGITIKKDENFSEWYTQVVQKAELADIRFGIQGFIVHRPWGFMIIKKIYEYLEQEVEKTGHLPFRFPIAVKEADLNREEEHAGFTPEVFWVTEAGDKKINERFGLRPTGEAQIYPVYSLWFRSYRDLPFKGYQSRHCVYRNEMTTRPFLRGREFMFFETHNVFATQKEAQDQIQEDLNTIETVIRNKMKIPFLYFRRPDWDRFLGAENTYTPDVLMPDGKRNQVGSTHELGQNFAKAFNIRIKNEDGKEDFAWQTCFGPGVWRIMASVIGVHGDDKGLVLPFDVAPIQIVIIPITFKGKEKASEKVMQLGKKLEKELTKHGFRTKFDDNKDESPGSKYNKWELKGVPVRLEIGPREVENNSVSLALRTEGKKKSITIDELEKEIKNSAEELDETMARRAEDYSKDNTRKADTMEELKKIMNKHRGFVKVPFCTVTKKGEACADKLQEETDGGKVCGTLYPTPEKIEPGKKCIVCGSEAKHVVYIAKSY